jgi:hypothetical protein
VFAILNGTKKISDALLSRFIVIHVEHYSRIRRNSLSYSEESVSQEIEKETVMYDYENMKTPNIRDVTDRHSRKERICSLECSKAVSKDDSNYNYYKTI